VRLQTSQPAVHTEALLAQLADRLKLDQPEPMRWIRATVGNSLRMIPVDDIDYLKSDTKYTLVAYRDEGQAAEALIRMPLKELIAQLDPQQFAQVHRSVVVNLRSIRRVTRGENETADIELKGRSERLPVSRSHLQFFKEM